MRSIALPVEDLVFGRLHDVWREAQFNKWFDVPREQVIVKQIKLGPVILRLAILDPDRAQNVMEDGMETNVAESEFIGSGFQLGLAVTANERAREVGAYRQIEEPVDRLGRLRNVEFNMANDWLRWLRRDGDCEKY